MVFHNFAKFAKYSEKIHFFQSSQPYLQRNKWVVEFQQFYSNKWKNDGPHPSTRSKYYLSIDSGHYGIYYAILNHDSDNKRKKSRKSLKLDYSQVIDGDILGVQELDLSTKFFILKINRDIHQSISYLRTVSRDLLSTLSIVKPKFSVVTVRQYSTKTIDDIGALKNDQTEDPEDTSNEFETRFLKTQTDNILEIYNSGDRNKLNLIYPLYQAIVRNNITIPSVDIYNVVLDSIAARTLDNDISMGAIEARLTNIMTVYQHLLDEISPSLRPSSTTYEIVLRELFKGATESISIYSCDSTPQSMLHESYTKSQEFSQVGIELLLSIKKIENLSLSEILPNLICILNMFPHLISRELFDKLMFLKDNFETSEAWYYIGMIGVSKTFSKLGFFKNRKELYEYILTNYESYKSACASNGDLATYEYDMYAILIASLIKTDNFPIATKFLDGIIIDYKQSLKLGTQTNISKKQMSDLLSIYLESLIEHDSAEMFDKAYELFVEISRLSYLPELSVEIYNSFINHFIGRYYDLEKKKQGLACTEEPEFARISKSQAGIYSKVCALYDCCAIRKDHHNRSISNNSHVHFYPSKYSCREYLLSLSIDLGDHERAFQIIKEIVLKNHLIVEKGVLHKLLEYLYLGSVSNGYNRYYYDLMTEIIEDQSLYYQHDISLLTDYLTEVSKYILSSDSPATLEYLLNSQMVNNCFKNFTLSTCNIYGLAQVSNFLYQYVAKNLHNVSNTQLFKVAHIQSMLLCGLEDTENYYLELGSEVVNFRNKVHSDFKSILEIVDKEGIDIMLSDSIVEASNLCDGTIREISEVKSLEFIETQTTINLSVILSINYEAGVRKFLMNFRKGYNFSALTWLMIINERFAIDLLSKKLGIEAKDLVERLISLDMRAGDITILLKSLIGLKFDKITINVIKAIMRNPDSASAELLSCIYRVEGSTKNLYLKELMMKCFDKFYGKITDKSWISLYSKFLSLQKEYELLIRTATDLPIVERYDLVNEQQVEILHQVFLSYIKLNRLDEFQDMFKKVFNNASKNSELLKSEQLMCLLLKYYTMCGSFDMVVDTLAPRVDGSSSNYELIRFAELMRDQTKNKEVDMKKEHNLQCLSISLLQCLTASQMKELYMTQDLVHKTELFSAIMKNLNKAAVINDLTQKSNSLLKEKFNVCMSFMCLINVTKLDCKELVYMIHFFAITKSMEILNYICVNFLGSNGLQSLLNMDHHEVILPSERDKFTILQSLKDAFAYMNDKINLHFILKYCSRNDLDLYDNDLRGQLHDYII